MTTIAPSTRPQVALKVGMGTMPAKMSANPPMDHFTPSARFGMALSPDQINRSNIAGKIGACVSPGGLIKLLSEYVNKPQQAELKPPDYSHFRQLLLHKIQQDERMEFSNFLDLIAALETCHTGSQSKPSQAPFKASDDLLLQKLYRRVVGCLAKEIPTVASTESKVNFSDYKKGLATFHALKNQVIGHDHQF